MPLRNEFVSVVIPLDNDAGVLEPVLREVGAVLRGTFRDYEVILVDDASTDGTSVLVDRLIKEVECLRYIRLARRFGLDVGMSAGLDAAIGDYVVVMEPGCDPPAELSRLVQACVGGADVVIGTSDRRGRGRGLFQISRRVFYWLCRRLITDRLPATATHFMAFSRRSVNAISRVKQHDRHLAVVACSLGYSTALVPYKQVAAPIRRHGFAAALEHGIATLVTNSVSPLRLVTYISAFAGFCNLFYILYVVAINFFKDRVAEGWTTLSLQVSGMFFLVFLVLTVISEYLGQTLQASKDRPLYHVQEERSSTRPFADAGRRNIVEDSKTGRLAG